MKDYVAEFQSRLAEIDADSKSVHIINAGVMNHGKSSLFNSLMDAETFQVQDIRQTVENKTERWFDDVYLTDTPGLEAEGADDAAAYDAYRRANLIIFVHNVNVGELHKKELDAVNKIKALFNDDDFFWKHFCLVLTFKDSDSSGSNIDAIRAKSLADIKSNCGSSNFPTFVVSNTRYKKGRAENKSKLVELSGIQELRSYLQKNLPAWRSENAYFRTMRIKREKAALIEELNAARKNVQQKINQRKSDIENRQQNFLARIEAALNQRNTEQKAAADFDKSQEYTLQSMQREYQRLCEAEERASDRYFDSNN